MSRFVLAAVAATPPAAAGHAAIADAIKVLVIARFSGPFAMYGKQFREATQTYEAQRGVTAGAHECSFV